MKIRRFFRRLKRYSKNMHCITYVFMDSNEDNLKEIVTYCSRRLKLGVKVKIINCK